jgi:hypothetical protein
MMDTIVNRCINKIPNDIASLSPVLPLPVIQDDPSSIAGNHEILDTRDLSQFDITFEISPGLEISNEQSCRTLKRPVENELDASNFVDNQRE